MHAGDSTITRIGPHCVTLLLLVGPFVGCDDAAKRKPVTGSEISITAREPTGVLQACSQCHVFPAPNALPKNSWTKVIDEMVTIAGEMEGAALHPADVAEARDYFATRSPEALSLDPASSNGEDDSDIWKVRHFTPPGLERALVPAVAHVVSARLAEGEPLSLLVSEMRSRSVLHLAFDIPDGGSPVLYPMLRNANYPAHIAVTDIDADGRGDLFIAGIGSMQPTNAMNGTIILASQREGRRFRRQIVAEGLGRPTDVRAADLDGDGDLDAGYTAFGLRGPGQLAILENRSSSRGQFEVHQRLLDSRDGFTSFAIEDMDADGRPDIVALLAQEHEQVMVYRNEGAMQFSSRIVWAAPHSSWAFSQLHVADINADGSPDILTTNGDSLDYNVRKPYSGVQYFENQGGLQFRPVTIGALPGCSAAGSADLDGDGDLDVVATAFMPLSTPGQWIEQQLASVVWFENVHTDAISTWKRHTVEWHSASHPTVAIADFDGDDRVDIVVGNYVWIDAVRGPLYRSPYVSLYSRSDVKPSIPLDPG